MNIFDLFENPLNKVEAAARDLFLSGHSEQDIVKLLLIDSKQHLDSDKVNESLLDKIRYAVLTAKIKLREDGKLK